MLKRNEGIHGENLAVTFLQKNGFVIIDRNFRIRGGEIDIIAIDGDTLSFVEVKTRMSRMYGTPLEAISYWKLKALIKTAQYYKSMHPKLPELMRIDAVSIVLAYDKSVASIDLVKNIS
jgi:putative endonuclease